jgi:predicted HAD superfamily phosphohydrolase
MVWRLPELQKMPRIYVAPRKFTVSRGTTPCTKIKMDECKEPCENEIDAVLEPLHSDDLDREEELQHAFEEAIEEVI